MIIIPAKQHLLHIIFFCFVHHHLKVLIENSVYSNFNWKLQSYLCILWRCILRCIFLVLLCMTHRFDSLIYLDWTDESIFIVALIVSDFSLGINLVVLNILYKSMSKVEIFRDFKSVSNGFFIKDFEEII